MAKHNGQPQRIFIGTYTKKTSRGIYTLTLDPETGALGEPELAVEAPNPTFIALAPSRKILYSVCAGPSWASSFRVDRGTGRLSVLCQSPADASPTPCHIAIDRTGRIALAANYHLGLAAAIPLDGEGGIGTSRVVAHSGKGPDPERQKQAHVHSTNFDPENRYALVCDLGLDRIYSYAIDWHAIGLIPAKPAFIAAAPRSGPRHVAFNKAGTRVYVINELDNTCATYAYDAVHGSLRPLQTVSVIPKGAKGPATAAEVCLHPNGRFLYGSSRGPDTLAVFAVDDDAGTLTPVDMVPCGGKGPRGFALSADGRWLVCAHQDSDTLCAFRVDPETGKLSRIAGTRAVSMPVCVVFLD